MISNVIEGAIKIAFIYKIRCLPRNLGGKIEHCFKQLKSNGFNLEAMNIGGKAKQNLMLAVMVFTYVLSVLEGLKDYKKIALKKYADGTTSKAISVFRNGLDKIVILTHSFLVFIKYILKQFRIMEKTYSSFIILNV